MHKCRDIGSNFIYFGNFVTHQWWSPDQNHLYLVPRSKSRKFRPCRPFSCSQALLFPNHGRCGLWFYGPGLVICKVLSDFSHKIWQPSKRPLSFDSDIHTFEACGLLLSKTVDRFVTLWDMLCRFIPDICNVHPNEVENLDQTVDVAIMGWD